MCEEVDAAKAEVESSEMKLEDAKNATAEAVDTKFIATLKGKPGLKIKPGLFLYSTLSI